MASFDDLVTSQKKTGEKIETIIRNYKKDPSSRKTSPSYFQERLRRLDEEWAAFETTDSKIRLIDSIPLDHKYFTEDYYTAVMDIVHKYKEEFEQSILRVAAPVSKESIATQKPIQTAETEVATVEAENLVRLMRRQAAKMSTLDRLLNKNFTNDDTIVASKLWQGIEDLHYEIAEMCDDAVNQGYDMNRFIQLEDQLRTACRAVTINASTNHSSTNDNNSNHVDAMPISKIVIPRFDGNHLKWQEFYDLFLSLVVSRSMPKVQKMWYLKTQLVGEAANLIKHFAATEENFDAAWAVVVERYNNKRLLVNKLVQELVDTPSKGSNDNYKSLHDRTHECLLALQNLQVDTNSWDPLLIHLLLKKVDQVTRLRYEQSLKNPREVPTIKEFLEFLERNFQAMEAITEKPLSQRSRLCTSITFEGQNATCIMCKGGRHPLFVCKMFLQASPALRLQFIQKQKYCVNCLRPGHNSKSCTSRTCMKCNQKHNTLLHLDKVNKSAKGSYNQISEEGANASTKPKQLSQEPASLSAAEDSKSNNYILLSTAIIKVKANGKEVQCRALLDSGSQINLISERLIKRLGVSPKPTSISISGIGSRHTKVQRRINVSFQSRTSNFNTLLEAAVIPHIISPQPSQAFNVDNWQIPQHIELADPKFNCPDKIDVLLGAEFHYQLLKEGQIKLGNGLPSLQNTLLGWVLAGKIEQIQSSTTSCGVCVDSEAKLEEDIAQLWELENLQPVNKNLSASERKCEEHFVQTHTIDKGGRFIVKLPFCDNPETLGESYQIAFNRFRSLEHRLSKNPEIKAQYVKFMREYESLGHMTQVDINTTQKGKYFIPHHCVLRPESSTTKLRVVFDASTKTTTGRSLNDLMHVGPTVQSELFSILLRFRLPRFVFTTDIEKMYRQMLVHPDERRFQMIIWREDSTLPIKHYQLNTITYGTRSAPYLATKCLETIAKENMSQYPYGARFLSENFYVDDGIGGDDDLNTALHTQQELRHILNKHGLILQKWSANHQRLLQGVQEKAQEVNIDFNNANNKAVKTLGLTWIPTTDELCVRVSLENIRNISKRSVCSDLARLFDPLGLLAPVVVSAKILIQELWQLKLTWDEPLPPEFQKKWATFRHELQAIDNMKISRHIFDGHLSSRIQIHAFADASEKAYGAAIYIRSILKNEQVIVRLLCAKSRVAPLKRQTLPRLELCAALLCAQLTTRAKRDLKLENAPTYFWTDSEIVLAWLNSQSSSYQTFVANRIAAIQELSLAEQWQHVKSKENPADVLSRGISPRKLETCNLWLYGPIFLHGRTESWPMEYSKTKSINENDIYMERKKTTAVATTSESSTAMVYNIRHNGSFRTLQRVVGYMLRFINHCRKRKQQAELSLTVQELEQALIVIIRAIQQADFEEEINHLKKHNAVSKNSSCNNLTPFLDTNGIIRVGGRLQSSTLPFDARHPMLIPYNDAISKLLMEMIHKENRHCGPQALLAYVRQRYWPIKGKSTARAIVQHCVRCSRAKPQLLNQIMGNLPSTRITPARPFINSGVDFCGPIWIHYKIRGKKPQKAYIAVFCCFATKAVHLELVSDLTTEAFIGSLKRFISRRGHCKNLYCDNATNFVGAKNKLTELSEAIFTESAYKTIYNECTSRGITFHFIPPRAPHFGGLWEAAVKSAKHLLVRSVATASLTYEELDTVVIEIEGILNSRPISPMSSNPNDLAALTPGHFLIGEPLNAQVDANATHQRLSLMTRWKRVTHLKDEFWKRWSREYLCELQYRHKWQSQQPNIKPGEMVVIKEDNTTPLQWPLGRIVKVHKGDDGIIRVADIKTLHGICRRPITRLALLPVNCTESNEDLSQANPNLVHTPENEEPEPSKKRKRISRNPSMFTIVMALLLLPLVMGTQIHNKQFSSHLGIHFEGIGSAAISTTEWKLLVYYDLKEFWTEASIFSQGTRSLNHLCEQMQDKSVCTNLVKYFQHTESELNMDSTLLSGRIQKRAAIDLVGNIAHSLFGVLDSEYAEQMAHTISQVKENEEHLLRLLKNQTSIIDSTINVFKTGQEAAKKKFDQIDQQISEIYNKIHGNSEDQFQEKIYRVFSSLCIQLTITAANLQRTQSSIFEILTSTHHGFISPLLITPHQLQNEVTKIRFHLPETLELPTTKEDSIQLYKFMKAKGGLTQNTVVFTITLPLIERDKFEVFNLVPVPNWINNTLVSIKVCSSLLAVNIARNQYFPMSDNEFNSCTFIKEQMYICYKGQIRYELGASTCFCETNLFNNRSQADCPVQQMHEDFTWIPLRHQNKWIYATPSPSQATAVCKTEISQIILQGTGLLSLEPECTLKYKSMAVQGQQTIVNSVNTSYTNMWKITEKNVEERLKPLLNKIKTTEYISQIKNLTNLQESLATHNLWQLPNKLEAYNNHHTVVGYLALAITCCILIYLFTKRECKTRPTPAPRQQQTASEFTVHI